jgi:DNA-binding NtrC family response regulator
MIGLCVFGHFHTQLVKVYASGPFVFGDSMQYMNRAKIPSGTNFVESTPGSPEGKRKTVLWDAKRAETRFESVTNRHRWFQNSNKRRIPVLDILLLDDEPDLLALLEDQLGETSHRITTASDGQAGTRLLDTHAYDLVICDVRLPRVDGLTLLRRIRNDAPATEVIMMTGSSDVSQAVSALKEGAYDYLRKPFDVDELLLQIQRIEDTRILRRELKEVREELSSGSPTTSLLGQSPTIRRVQDLITMVAQSEAPVLVSGESGTGKEVVARLIHQQGARRDQPFIAVNCGALAENLVEAELFGHERGAFTDAVKKRDGRFKAADGGTLLLDEVAELPLAAQAKLLRVLQEGTFEPVGSNVAVRVNVRIISATHRNLAQRVKAGSFREDLYYRINVIEIPLPPLRERTGDLPILLLHFVKHFAAPQGYLPGISPAAWAALARYPFPGNVRELSHAVEHAMVLAGGRDIDVAHLPPAIVGGPLPPKAQLETTQPQSVRPLHLALRDFEHQYLLRALDATEGKRTRTAELLRISRKTLWEKLRHRDPKSKTPTVLPDESDTA